MGDPLDIFLTVPPRRKERRDPREVGNGLDIRRTLFPAEGTFEV